MSLGWVRRITLRCTGREHLLWALITRRSDMQTPFRARTRCLFLWNGAQYPEEKPQSLGEHHLPAQSSPAQPTLRSRRPNQALYGNRRLSLSSEEIERKKIQNFLIFSYLESKCFFFFWKLEESAHVTYLQWEPQPHSIQIQQSRELLWHFCSKYRTTNAKQVVQL